MNDWIIELTRMNGNTFEMDIRNIRKMEARKDGGTNVIQRGNRTPTPCREDMLQIALKMNEALREVSA